MDKKSWSAYRERAYQILAAREHSTYELRQKLERKGCPTDMAEELVEDLRAGGLVDDVRFGTMFVRSKLRQGWGRQRIVLELRNRGVRGDSLDAALEEYTEELSSESEEARALQIVARRLHSREDFNKVFRYLVSHGFSASCASRALESFCSANEQL